MSWRTVVINQRCKLETKLGYLVARGEAESRVHLSEIAVLIIESTAVSMTASLMIELLNRKVKVIFCDEKHNPIADVNSLYGRHNASGIVREQIKWSDGIKARVWQEIIKSKIYNQAMLMYKQGLAEYEMLLGYREDVQCGDITNREGHAAKVYFNNIFNKEFSRGDDNVINAALDYGYAVLLSLINREIVAKGAITQLGIWHNNEFNHYNLSSDMIEPFRVYVDSFVLDNAFTEFGSVQKHKMLEFLQTEVWIKEKKFVLINAVQLYVASVLDVLSSGDIGQLKMPQYI